MATIPSVWWDPSGAQILGVEDVEVNPVSLKRAGYRYISGDCESIEGACLWMWKKHTGQRWYIVLMAGDEKVASAICHSSSVIADVIREFQVIGSVIGGPK